MPTKTEPVWAAEFIISEGNGFISRDLGTLASGQNLRAGRVLGRITASGLWTALNPAAGDGSQTAAGILLDDVDASAGNRPCAVITRLAEVQDALLGWGTLNAGQQTTARTQLASANVIVRTAAV